MTLSRLLCEKINTLIKKMSDSIVRDLLSDPNKKFALFFNGGKDSTVLLHLVQQLTTEVLIVYIESEHEFPEVEKYVDEVFNNCFFRVLRYSEGMKYAIQDIKQRYFVTHVFTGIRKTDPYGSETDIVKLTDPSWPQVYLVNPLLHWSYKDIWDYIFANKLKYCSLYDEGYTSLGNTLNTIKNPHLICESENGGGYLPAYMLTDGTLERCGRLS